MRPDHFQRMVEAYRYREEKSWLPWRKLFTVLHNNFSDDNLSESEAIWLPMIDTVEEKEEIKPPALVSATSEEIRRIMIQDGIIKE